LKNGEVKLTKGKAFVFCLGSIMFIFIAMFITGIIKNNLDIIPVAACLTGIGALAGIYIGGSVANNGVKGKCWSQPMFDSENQRNSQTVGGGQGDEQWF
jgi:predicted MFS family arabinose efflux permease